MFSQNDVQEAVTGFSGCDVDRVFVSSLSHCILILLKKTIGATKGNPSFDHQLLDAFNF